MSRRRAAHRAGATRSLRGVIAGVVSASALLLGATALSLSFTPGTLAYYSDSPALVVQPNTGGTTATLTAGDATLTVSSAAISLSNLYPGTSQSAAFTVTNTGTVSLALSVAISGTTTANGLAATLAAGACPGTGAVSSGNIGVTLAPNASSTVCLAVSMPTTAPVSAQGANSTITATITGTQP